MILIAIGLTLVLLLGEIDLSAGGDRGCLCRLHGVVARQGVIPGSRSQGRC